MRKTLRLRLVPVKRTDLICVGCGNFRTELGIVAIEGSDMQAGVHRKCIPLLIAKSSKPSTETEA